VIAADAAAHTRTTYFKDLYYRLKHKQESVRAAMAVGRTVLKIIYYLLKQGTSYMDLVVDHFNRINCDQSIHQVACPAVACARHSGYSPR
jgi:predicted cupin superfamily sugar epimerase